jgi:hypothetical protein
LVVDVPSVVGHRQEVVDRRGIGDGVLFDLGFVEQSDRESFGLTCFALAGAVPHRLIVPWNDVLASIHMPA